MTFSSSTVGEAIDITIKFQATFDFVQGEVLTLNMPRYTDGSALSLADSINENYNLVLHPSIQFDGAWMEGNWDNNDNPYSTSRILLRMMRDLVRKGDFVEIKIYAENGIKAYCGHPAHDDFLSINATTPGERFLLSSSEKDRPTHLMPQPLMGNGCAIWGNCFERGTCDYCKGICTCEENWGAADDLIMTGRDSTRNCYSSKFIW